MCVRGAEEALHLPALSQSPLFSPLPLLLVCGGLLICLFERVLATAFETSYLCLPDTSIAGAPQHADLLGFLPPLLPLLLFVLLFLFCLFKISSQLAQAGLEP